MSWFTLIIASSLTNHLISTPAYASKSTSERQNSRQTTGFLYGGEILLSQLYYKGTDTRVLPLPLIGYRGEKLNVFGPFMSYDFAETGPLTLFVQLEPRLQAFDESDSAVFAGMNKRKNTLEAGLGYKIHWNQWRLSNSFLSELFGESDSTEIRTRFSRGFRSGPFMLIPSVSASYLSNDHVQYYYGVKANETTAERPFYQGLNTTNYSIDFTLATPLFFNGMSRFTLSHTWLGPKIIDSPLVDETHAFSFRYIFTKFF